MTDVSYSGSTVEVYVDDVLPPTSGKEGYVLSTNGVGTEWVPGGPALLLYLAQNYI